jgi:AcrR family transcriptional regulator
VQTQHPGGSSPRRRSAEVTRDRLLVAAVELFAEQGYDGVRVRHIAARAGVTTGAIYAHYRDVASLLADAAGRAVDYALQAVAAEAPDEFASVLRRFAHATTESGLTQEQALLLEAFVAARREPRLREVLSAVLSERLVVLEQVVRDAQRAGTVRADLPPGAVAWYVSLLPVGLLAGRAVDLPSPSSEESSAVLEALFRGLTPPLSA